MFRELIMMIIFVLIFTILCACGNNINNSNTVTLPEVEQKLREDFKKIGEVCFDDVISKDKKIHAEVIKYVRKRQCCAGHSNPMTILNDQITFNLRGLVTSKGEFKLAVASEGVFGRSTETEQKILWPVQLTSLGHLPDLYLETKLKRISEFNNILTKTKRQQLVDEVFAKYDAIKTNIECYQSTYQKESQKCPVNGKADWDKIEWEYNICP